MANKRIANFTEADKGMPSTQELHNLFNGRVIGRDDPRYDGARKLFYGGMDRHPIVIIQAADVEDVSKLVILANNTGLELAIRSGGHSLSGHSVIDGGIVLDLSLMKDIKINVEESTAWVQSGVTAEEYSIAADVHGLATGFGDTGSVAIGGLTLGGGVGYLARKYGLTIDNLLAAEIVTADGVLRYVDDQSFPDLFWAIRGGGGNFGVVTRFKFRLHPVGTVYGGVLFLPATPSVIVSFIKEAMSAPEELTTILNIITAPPMPFLPSEVQGKPVLIASMVYAGDVTEGERIIRPFRSLATPFAHMVRPMHYPEIYQGEDPNYHPIAAGRNFFINTVNQSTAETILNHLNASPGTMAVTQLRVLGGAITRVPVEATAYAHRNAPIMANVAVLYDNLEDRHLYYAWVSEFAASIQPGEMSSYINFIGDEGEDRVRQAYPEETWEKLVTIKSYYDPTNLFRHNHNIPTQAST